MTEELPDPSELFVKNEVLHVTRWTDMLVRLVLAGPVALLSILVDAFYANPGLDGLGALIGGGILLVLSFYRLPEQFAAC